MLSWLVDSLLQISRFVLCQRDQALLSACASSQHSACVCCVHAFIRALRCLGQAGTSIPDGFLGGLCFRARGLPIESVGVEVVVLYLDIGMRRILPIIKLDRAC